MTTTPHIAKPRPALAWLSRAAATSGLLIFMACASMPPPTEAIRAAELAIANAEQARVADVSAPELREAHDKLTAARAAVVEKEMIAAEQLADEARVGAELASARFEWAKAKVVNEEMQKSIDTLKAEMQRNAGERQ